MFCPNCRLEYRPGFTECSDCLVTLVESLPEAEEPHIPRDDQGRELLWSGLSRQLYRAIAAALDARHIAHVDVDKEFGILATMAQAATLIWIDPRDRSAARQALADAMEKGPSEQLDGGELGLDSTSVDPFGFRRQVFNRADGGERADRNNLAQGLGREEPVDEDVPDDVVEDFNADDATVEVWVGPEEEMADIFADCLTNVGIGCVIHDDNGKWRVLVLPTSEKRAREIVREITDANSAE